MDLLYKMNIRSKRYKILQHDAPCRRQRAVGVNLTCIADNDARFTGKILVRHAAKRRPMNLHPRADRDRLGRRKLPPPFDRRAGAARIQNLRLVRNIIRQIGMMRRKKLPALALIGIEGYRTLLIGAPRLFRERHDDAVPFSLKPPAMRQQSVILPLITRIPREIPLRRKKRRRKEAHRPAFSDRPPPEAQISAPFFRRNIRCAAYIRRFHEVAARRKRSAAKKTDHADAFIFKNLQKFSKHIRLCESDVIVEINLELRIGKSQRLVRLRRIRLLCRQREKLRLISRRQAERLQGSQGSGAAHFIRLAYKERDLFFVLQDDFLLNAHRSECFRDVRQCADNTAPRHNIRGRCQIFHPATTPDRSL